MRTRICMRGGNSGGEVGLNPLLRSFYVCISVVLLHIKTYISFVSSSSSRVAVYADGARSVSR